MKPFNAICPNVLGLLLLCGCSQNEAPESVDAASNNTSSTIVFEDATQSSGVEFRHIASRSEQKRMPEIMGSGVAIADFNRDGAPDIVLVNGGKLGELNRSPNALSKLYLNDGKGKFTDATSDWALPSQGYGMGVAVGDYDNNGYPDLFLTHFDGNDVLLKNNGRSFENVSQIAGIVSDGKWSTSAGFFDYNHDGYLDLFLVRYVEFSSTNSEQSLRNGIVIYPTPLLFEGVADRLWRGDGKGGFVDVSNEVGLSAAPNKGLALAIGDVDLDGTQEVYVANDTAANQLWLTKSSGPWTEIAQLSGTAYNEMGNEEGSMGADFSDIDGNNLLDITVTNFQYEATSIYRQQSALLFSEVSDLVGVGRSSRSRLSFGIDFFDANNDGHEDLLVANGHVEDNIHLSSDSVTFAQPNSLYLNLGNGNFSDISESSGNALLDSAVSRGLATADLDGDGALDFVITNNDGPAQIAMNRSKDLGNFVMLWLEGDPSNRSAIGARVVAKVGERTLHRQVMGAQSYLSISDFRLHFGLNKAEKIDQLTIMWPSGNEQIVTDLPAGQFYYVREGAAALVYIPGQQIIEPIK